MSTQHGAGGTDPSITAAPPAARSGLGTLALALTGVSIVGFLILATGSIAEWKGFSDYPDVRAGQMAVGWVVLAIILSVIVLALESSLSTAG